MQTQLELTKETPVSALIENSTDDVLYSITDGIATITLNRPKQRNALSLAAAGYLHALWSEIDADDSVRVVILDAADCGTFCAGMDLKEAVEIKRTRGVDILEVLQDPF